MLSLPLAIGNNAYAPAVVSGASTLSLDFANGAYSQSGTSYALASLPGYAYSRSGSKAENTATGASTPFAANTPAIVSGFGYYSEGAFRNELNWSQDFTSIDWNKDGATVTGGFSAPDGTSTATKLTPSASNVIHRVYTNAIINADPCTHSAYVKANGYTQVALRESTSTGAGAAFTLSGSGTVNGVYNTGGLTVSNAQITALGSGWYFISATFGGTGVTQGLGVYVLDGAWTTGSVEYAWTANGTSGIYVWQAQLCAAALPGPAILTTTAAVSVGADSMAMTVPNGTYSAVYTYADASTQTISTTVSGTTYTVPLYNATLTKSPLAKVVLT